MAEFGSPVVLAPGASTHRTKAGSIGRRPTAFVGAARIVDERVDVAVSEAGELLLGFVDVSGYFEDDSATPCTTIDDAGMVPYRRHRAR